MLLILVRCHSKVADLQTVVIRKGALDKTILEIATEMTNKVNDPDETVNVTMMEDYIKVCLQFPNKR